jgi:FMN phosphatase YigB (HAD superfamily)
VNIFFDVDDTLLSFDGALRPNTHQVLEQLIADGHTVYIWSGVGIRKAFVEREGLGHLVAGIYQKPLADFADGLETFGIPVLPDFVVDDYPEIVEHFGGLHIKPYMRGMQTDTELLAIPALVEAMAEARSLDGED